MTADTGADFYASYAKFKNYATPSLKAKHVTRFDDAFWHPAACEPGMSVLEVGCGLGQFLAYLKIKGVTDFLGIDQDAALQSYLPEEARANFEASDVWDFLNSGAGGRSFDRIVLFDVLEHFSAEDGTRLLVGLDGILRAGGRIVIKVPNMASPWGAQHQYGDLTHKTAYGPKSLRQLALAAGLYCAACHPVIEGSLFRRFFDGLIHGFFAHVLLSPPEIWTANVIAIFERPRA